MFMTYPLFRTRGGARAMMLSASTANVMISAQSTRALPVMIGGSRQTEDNTGRLAIGALRFGTEELVVQAVNRAAQSRR